MNDVLKNRIDRDFAVDYTRPPEAHRGAFWGLVHDVEKLADATGVPGLTEAIESALELLELHDHDYHA